MIKKIIFIFFILHLKIAAQGFRTFVKIPKGTNHCTKDVFEITNGNFFGLGISIDTLNNKVRYPLTVVILDNQGKTLKIKNYIKTKTPFSNAPITIRTSCKVGNYIYFAGTVFDSSYKYTGVLIKFNFNGDTIWWKNYLAPNYDIQIHKVSPSVDGGFLLVGNVYDQINSIQPSLLIKTDAIGNEIWRKVIHKSNPDATETKAVLQDSLTKKIVLVGNQNLGSGIYYSHIMILDSLGNLIVRNGFQQGGVHDIIQTKDKGIVVVGFEDISGHQPTERSFALKFNLNSPSSTVWRIDNFGPITMNNTFYNVNEFPNGNLLLAGSIDTTGLTNNIFTGLVRYVEVNSNGQILKTRYYNYALDLVNVYGQYVYSTNITSDGGWISTNSPIHLGNNPMIFVKYDANGCDSTLAYCANRVGLNNFITNNNELIIYPNPSQNVLNIEFENNFNNQNYTLKIVDVLGRTSTSLSMTTSNKISLDLSKLPNGIYFLQVWEEEQLISTKKFLKE